MKFRLLLIGCGIIGLAGCSIWDTQSVRLPSDEAEKSKEKDAASMARLVGDMTTAYGNNLVRIENVALVTNLPGTGSDPGPSPYRQRLVADMQARGVDSPNTILASKTVSLVLVQAFLRPGIQKGERVDCEVRIPGHSETTSLAGGYLMETRLQEMALLGDQQMHPGHVLGIAQGPVLVDQPAPGDKNTVSLGHGRVLGGVVALKDRTLGLMLKPEVRSAFLSARIAAAISKRFYDVQKGVQVGMAKAKNDTLIELTIHGKYKDNVERYMQVVQAIAIQELPAQQMKRMERLKEEIFDPEKAGPAARQLEAIGRNGIELLKPALKSTNLEVRFCAAEALAYLDQREAAEPLGDICRQAPALRVFALSALSALDDASAVEQLHDLLNQPSAETRYGAFRALSAMTLDDRLARSDPDIKEFSYHVLDTSGPAMVHVTRSRRPEVVLFGREQRFSLPLLLNAGNDILVSSNNAGDVIVSKYAVGQPDQKRVVSPRVDDVIRAIADMGGTYPDVVRAIQEAKAHGALEGRFAVDAVPDAGREYDRSEMETGDPDARPQGAGPKNRPKTPDLFSTFEGDSLRSKSSADKVDTGGPSEINSEKSEETPGYLKGLWDKMTSWGSD